MPTTSNFGWTTPADTDLVKDGAAAIRTLGNGVDTSFVDLKGGTTGQNLRKASNTDLDFTFAGDATNTVVDAAGDLLYGTAADTLGRLAIGTAGQVLKVNSGATAPEWGAPTATFKGALVYMANAVTQTLSTNTYTAINFASEQFDTDAFHSTSTNTNRLTIPAGLGGYYAIYANLRFDTNGTGIRRLDFEVNGSGNTYGVAIFTPNATSNSTVASTITLNLVAGDWVGIQALQNSGGNLNVTGNSAIAGSFFGITYLGA